MSNLRFLCKYVVHVPWRLLQITVTIISITKALLVSVRPMIVLINGVRTTGKLHLLFQPTASVDRAQMAGFRGWADIVEMELDIAEI